MLKFLRARILPVLLGVCLMGVAGISAAADNPVLDRIIKSETIRVGMSGNQPPFNAKGRDGSLIGFEVDLARALAGALGVEVEFVQRPFGELLGALNKGDVDMVMSGMAITKERARDATFLGPYMLSGKSILTKSDTLARAKEAGDINNANIRLAALKGSTSQQFVERNLPDSKLTTVADYDEGVSLILENKVDAMVADMPICMLSILRFPDAGFTTLTRPMTVEPIGVAVSAKDPQFAHLIDNYIDAFEKTGALNQLRKKWLEDNSWVAALP